MGLLSNIFKLAFGGKELSVQNPLAIDGDSIYSKDIDIERSDITGFTGLVTDPFSDLHTENLNDSSAPIKTFLIHLQRTIISPLIGIGSSEGSTFSNVKIIGILSGGIEMVLADFSGDNTVRTTQFFSFPNAGLNAIKIEFHTTNTIGITNIYVPKLMVIASIPETSIVLPSSYKAPYLLNGGSQDMAVDGSVTPVDFVYEITGASPGRWVRNFIDLQDGNQTFLPENFGAITGSLTNGVDIIAEKDGIEYLLENWKTNMDISMTCYDFTQPYRSGAYIGRWTITNDTGGSPITFFPGDKLIVRIKDNLIPLELFRFRAKFKQ